MKQIPSGLAAFSSGSGDFAYLVNSLCAVWNNTSQQSIEINQDTLYATFKLLRLHITQNVPIDDVNFSKIDELIDDIAGNLNNKFKHLNFSDAAVAFNDNEFNYLGRDISYVLNNIVPKPERKINEEKITSLSFSGLISSVFENKNAGLRDLNLDDTQKATLAALATSKAYVANKFLRQEDVSKTQFIKGAENVKRQIELYIKTRRGLEALYAKAGVEKLNLNYAEMKNKFCRAVICLEELKNMKNVENVGISKTSMMFATRLRGIHSYFDQMHLVDNLRDSNQDALKQDLIFYFDNIGDFNNKIDNINQYIEEEQIAQQRAIQQIRTARQVAGVKFAKEFASEYS